MPVLPDRIQDRIAWFEQRIASWTAGPTNIGLAAAQITQLTSLIADARAAYDAAQAARTAAKNATLAMSTAVSALSTYGGDLIKTIKAFAESSQNPEVYVKASVPPPAAPSPSGPPPAPTDVTADPNADGTITLRWKGSLANQTFYTVWRRPGATGSFVQIGSVAKKTFVDVSAPSGQASISYFVRGQRGSAVSPTSDITTVQFGGPEEVAEAA
jgi:hypothetical protein